MPGVVSNWGEAILTSFSTAIALVFAFIPRLLGFLVILLVGYVVALLVSKALTFLLRKLGFDRFAARIGLNAFEQRMNVHMDPAGLLGRVVFWFVFLIFLVPAVDALGLTTVSNLLGQVINYIPNVFVAILILFLGILAATFISDIVRGFMAHSNFGSADLYANIAKYAIIVFVSLMALEQLQITPTLINILVTALVGGTALAFGLSFGLGGQETARRLLNRGEVAMNTLSLQRSTQQSINQARNIAEMQADQYRNRQANAVEGAQMEQQQSAYPQAPVQPPLQSYPQNPAPTQQPYPTNPPTLQ